ncbi:MAG: class I SAM-dependent methyltransferase [Rhizobiaceae bacterium]|nr:class I SAM-dependent methyltransferase [Rhizobiaceae bacterium]
MNKDASATLFHPFVTEELALPDAGAQVLFIGARPGARLPEGFVAPLKCVQGFRPDYLGLVREGREVTPVSSASVYDTALVLAARHRAETELRLASALTNVKAGGLVVVAGGNEDGVGALRTRLEKRDGHFAVPVAGRLSKHHGVVFWLYRTPQAEAFAQQRLDALAARPLVEGRFRTAPSSFSHDGIDAGSRLLAECLPADMTGSVADFCAGWGFLSAELARRGSPIARVDLYEADHASLEAARDNMARLAPNVSARFLWWDLVGEPVSERYDAIIMNPPFHQGRASEPGLGEALIGSAAKALRKGGRLLLVANRQLPYEAALAKGFGRVERLREEAGFKVFCAVR